MVILFLSGKKFHANFVLSSSMKLGPGLSKYANSDFGQVRLAQWFLSLPCSSVDPDPIPKFKAWHGDWVCSHYLTAWIFPLWGFPPTSKAQISSLSSLQKFTDSDLEILSNCLHSHCGPWFLQIIPYLGILRLAFCTLPMLLILAVFFVRL